MHSNTSNLIDALATCPQISAKTRKAVGWALNTAREMGHEYPTVRDIAQTCADLGTDMDTLACAWGYVRAHDNEGDPGADPYYDVRVSWIEDNRRGIVPNSEALMVLMLFCLTIGIGAPPFPFSVGRKTPRRVLRVCDAAPPTGDAMAV